MILLITGILLITLGVLMQNKILLFTFIGSGASLCITYFIINRNQSYFWKTGLDGACDLATRKKTRNVYCVDEKGKQVAENLCPGKKKPKEELNCG